MSNRSCEDCKFEKDGMICKQGHVRRIKYENLNVVGHIPLEDCHAWGEKSKCWCSWCSQTFPSTFCSWADEMYFKYAFKVQFCPVCGRLLREEK